MSKEPGKRGLVRECVLRFGAFCACHPRAMTLIGSIVFGAAILAWMILEIFVFTEEPDHHIPLPPM